jgi:hypothetical protein
MVTLGWVGGFPLREYLGGHLSVFCAAAELRQQFQSLIWDFIGEGHDMKTELESCIAANQQPPLRNF